MTDRMVTEVVLSTPSLWEHEERRTSVKRVTLAGVEFGSVFVNQPLMVVVSSDGKNPVRFDQVGTKIRDYPSLDALLDDGWLVPA